jgi:transcriptional regulator with XRE-family HTH domain
MNSTNFSSKDYLDIDSILQDKKISKTELANKLGVPRQSIYSYLNGNVSLEKMVNIANALDVPVWQLFSGSDNALNGFVEFKGTIHRIQSAQDLERLLEAVKGK